MSKCPFCQQTYTLTPGFKVKNTKSLLMGVVPAASITVATAGNIVVINLSTGAEEQWKQVDTEISCGGF